MYSYIGDENGLYMVYPMFAWKLLILENMSIGGEGDWTSIKMKDYIRIQFVLNI